MNNSFVVFTPVEKPFLCVLFIECVSSNTTHIINFQSDLSSFSHLTLFKTPETPGLIRRHFPVKAFLAGKNAKCLPDTSVSSLRSPPSLLPVAASQQGSSVKGRPISLFYGCIHAFFYRPRVQFTSRSTQKNAALLKHDCAQQPNG